jgi:hypothetical protein
MRKSMLCILCALAPFEAAAQEKAQFDFAEAGKVKPFVRPVSEQVPHPEKALRLDPQANLKNRILIGAQWSEGSAHLEAGVKLNSREYLHFGVKF